MTKIAIIIILIMIVHRLLCSKEIIKTYPDYTTDLRDDNPYFELNKEIDICDNEGPVSAHRLKICGYNVLRINQTIEFDKSFSISKDQFIVIDSRPDTILSNINKGDILLVKNELPIDNSEYEEYLGKISTIHKDGSVSIVRVGKPKRKLTRSFIVGKIIKIS